MYPKLLITSLLVFSVMSCTRHDAQKLTSPKLDEPFNGLIPYDASGSRRIPDISIGTIWTNGARSSASSMPNDPPLT